MSEGEPLIDELEVSVHRIERENRPTLVEIVANGERIDMALESAVWVADRIRDAAALHGEQWT